MRDELHASSPVDEQTGASLGLPKRPQPKQSSGGSSMNGPLYMQTSGSNVVLVRKLKRKEESFWRAAARWFVENQVGLSFNLIALLFLAHGFIPKARSVTHKFFHLSYLNDTTGRYGVGIDDVYLIAFCVVAFTGLRAWTMEYVLAPIAKMGGVTKRKDLTRFSEQAWLLVYYCFLWPLGMYIYCNSPHYLNLRELWTAWPNREMDGLMKGYILVQWAFWIQQILVIHVEEKRKDHYQMLSHHFVTCALISSCYSYHHTRVGNLILVIMDVVDLFLPLAKCLKYAGYTTICDYLFGLFMISWLLARHVTYCAVCWSIYAHTPEIMPTGCFKGSNNNLVGPVDPPPGYGYLLEPFYNSSGHVCYNETVKWAFLTPLIILQFITIFWFTLIIRVAVKVLRGAGAEDTRSDDEAVAEESEDEYVYEEAEALKQDVGVESLDLKGWERRHGKFQSSSSGVSLPGHSDRKELLGRIGCDKQVD
ncbi:Sphingosine N-acyltransferase-like protein [Emericellopsis cladophorae]|uniref:Sphingosine N-acyltransferase-like protein n=1 Tax=Emericellopsis cladophorae TaxID=2686198 RepID=A0A9P9Y693_9HYPO|nr:Sphingosine N-acyltransferase-like protein [Emericellopsis cladophorae]KAI6784257.1 Sphingosine N-acyltransferase-like protein [Emericellopsis cladophorae]